MSERLAAAAGLVDAGTGSARPPPEPDGRRPTRCGPARRDRRDVARPAATDAMWPEPDGRRDRRDVAGSQH